MVSWLGNPIISTSIRDEDDVIEYTTDPSLILEKWDKHVDIVIDGGYGDNIASTVIDLTGDEAEVNGSGDVEVYASKSLYARVSGSGDIDYKGNPANVDKKTSGSGDVTAH